MTDHIICRIVDDLVQDLDEFSFNRVYEKDPSGSWVSWIELCAHTGSCLNGVQTLVLTLQDLHGVLEKYGIDPTEISAWIQEGNTRRLISRRWQEG